MAKAKMTLEAACKLGERAVAQGLSDAEVRSTMLHANYGELSVKRVLAAMKRVRTTGQVGV